jgi:hypothetical protein
MNWRSSPCPSRTGPSTRTTTGAERNNFENVILRRHLVLSGRGESHSRSSTITMSAFEGTPLDIARLIAGKMPLPLSASPRKSALNLQCGRAARGYCSCEVSSVRSSEGNRGLWNSTRGLFQRPRHAGAGNAHLASPLARALRPFTFRCCVDRVASSRAPKRSPRRRHPLCRHRPDPGFRPLRS